VLGAGGNTADGSFMRAALYFNADMPALGADELLRRRQTYFVLPVGMLGRPLASADMAAPAVRTSDALAAKARMARAAGTARRGLTEEAAERLEAAEAELPGCGGWSLGRRRARLHGYFTDLPVSRYVSDTSIPRYFFDAVLAKYRKI